MYNSPKTNVTSVIAVIWAFWFGTALSFDATVAIRGRRDLSNEKVSVYRCDSSNQRIASTISNKTEILEDAGLDIRICFQASQEATSNSLYILKIDDFTFTKDRTNGDLAAAGPTRQIPVIMRQNAVDHGIAMSTDLTKIFCDPGSVICAIETRLTGYFFLTSGAIRGNGSVMMQRGKDERRELQQMDAFEDVFIELEFTGGGRNPIPPKKRTAIIVGIITLLLLTCCCCGIFCCFLAGVCCFAGRDKREDTDDDNIEEVSVKIEWSPNAKNSKKNGEGEDLSETESLEDDKYWGDDVDISDGESESDGNHSEIEMSGHTDFPAHDAKEESKRKSKKNKSIDREHSLDLK